ncbi:MAG: hypothetical protein KQI35_11355 [Bacteroidetes bacterium]|nr:hypothetical protein [Bacteroidota bacterium]
MDKITRIYVWSDVKTKYNERVFIEDRDFCVDSTFLDVFTFPVTAGNPDNALKRPCSIVLITSMVESGIKEIGIRKTFGVANNQIVWLFSQEFAKWILLANVIAWFSMQKWLQSFEYRIDPGIRI